MLDMIQRIRSHTFDSFAYPWLCSDNDFIMDELPTIKKMAVKGKINTSMRTLDTLSHCSIPSFKRDDAYLLSKRNFTYVPLVGTSYLDSSLESLTGNSFNNSEIIHIYNYHGHNQYCDELKSILHLLNHLFLQLGLKLELINHDYELTGKGDDVIAYGLTPHFRIPTECHYDFGRLLNDVNKLPPEMYGVSFGIHLYEIYLKHYKNMNFFDCFEAVMVTLFVVSRVSNPVHSSLKYFKIVTKTNKDIVNMFHWFDLTYKKV